MCANVCVYIYVCKFSLASVIAIGFHSMQHQACWIKTKAKDHSVAQKPHLQVFNPSSISAHQKLECCGSRICVYMYIYIYIHVNICNMYAYISIELAAEARRRRRWRDSSHRTYKKHLEHLTSQCPKVVGRAYFSTLQSHKTLEKQSVS